MRILFDQNMSKKLRRDLPEHQITLTREMRWEKLGNGILLGEAHYVYIDENLRESDLRRGKGPYAKRD